MKRFTDLDTMNADEFANFCRVHLGAFVRTACLMQAAIDTIVAKKDR